MRKNSIWILFSFVFFACSQAEKDINTAENLTVEDFINSFPLQPLPIQFNSNNLDQKESDSFLIIPKVVMKFLPDSIFKKDFPNTNRIKFYRKARHKAEETKESYLFLLAEDKNKKKLFVLSFNEKDEYTAALQLIEKTKEKNVLLEGGLDNKLTITKTKNKEYPDKKIYYEKNAFIYNNANGKFTLILTDSNLPLDETIYNPIDTISKKNTFSGDYYMNKKNFVSIRDGAKEGKIQFFIHIDKNETACTGSLRGDLVQVKPKVFHYSKADDHCVIEFSFIGKKLQVRELEACGNHRGVRCNFDGKYNKK